MDTKQKGDIAEQSAIVQALKRGWGVIKPVGDRMPYYLVFDVDGVLTKIQVKYAWYDKKTNNYVTDTRRTKTNRRVMVRKRYQSSDFDFALIYIENHDIFYIIPIDSFNQYNSQISLVEMGKRQRKPRSAQYRNAWNLISEWAVHKATYVRFPIKLGETGDEVIPSQAPIINDVGEGVET